jgi:hypothetical protein
MFPRYTLPLSLRQRIVYTINLFTNMVMGIVFTDFLRRPHSRNKSISQTTNFPHIRFLIFDASSLPTHSTAIKMIYTQHTNLLNFPYCYIPPSLPPLQICALLCVCVCVFLISLYSLQGSNIFRAQPSPPHSHSPQATTHSIHTSPSIQIYNTPHTIVSIVIVFSFALVYVSLSQVLSFHSCSLLTVKINTHTCPPPTP